MSICRQTGREIYSGRRLTDSTLLIGYRNDSTHAIPLKKITAALDDSRVTGVRNIAWPPSKRQDNQHRMWDGRIWLW
jgi:hypothetical protein